MDFSWELVGSGVGNRVRDGFWVEEGPNQSLYIVAEGAAVECALAIKAIRDQFFGEAIQEQTPELKEILLDSLRAANDLLLARKAMGVSCICAISQPEGHTFLALIGSCRAHLFRSQERVMEGFPHRAPPLQTLGTAPTPQILQAEWALGEGDLVLLSSARGTEGLHEGELATLATRLKAASWPEEAEGIIAGAFGGEATVIAITSRRRTEPAAFAPVPETEAFIGEELALGRKPSPKLPMPHNLRWPIEGRWMAIALTILVALALSFWGLSRTVNRTSGREGVAAEGAVEVTPIAQLLELAAEPTSTATPFTATLPRDAPTPSPTSDTDAIWQRIDKLWFEGDAGSVPALQEIVALLEQLQLQTPTDPRVEEKLAVARINLAYRQRMQEVSSYWGNGETSAARAASWARIVETLEALHRQPLPSSYAQAALEKLYAAHVNYGKSLEAAGRYAEARGQYERALELDPRRPEAIDALRRLRP